MNRKLNKVHTHTHNTVERVHRTYSIKITNVTPYNIKQIQLLRVSEVIPHSSDGCFAFGRLSAEPRE